MAKSKFVCQNGTRKLKKINKSENKSEKKTFLSSFRKTFQLLNEANKADF